ncbi:hypothetical protein SAMN05660209_04973 [Geodermatophilus africanus]|uniref:Uncharacterized protein n=1 Tax=Geodermatophilus africanus TaxID=1137993 RepID=A0A1H3R0X5_9ACTN|nr:hypothetical protein [Geodermatophilus africanus]SDZ19143.1 hypothetical protein SAMN05660209_04973 [Geodermatophilus africanus]
MIIAVVLVLLALVVLGVVLYTRRGGAQARAHRQRQRELSKALAVATKTHASAIKATEKELKSVRSAYDKSVRGAERTLTELRSPDGRRLGHYRGVTLHELSISTPQGKSSLIGAQASVDTAGNLAVTRRATLTRTVAGGVLFGPVGAIIGGAGFKKASKHDNRELYLMIETPTLVAVVECPPDQGLKARAFAAQITTAAKQSEAIAAGRPQQIADAESALEAARADTAALTAVESKLASVSADPAMLAAIDAAKQAVDAHIQAAPVRKALPAAS